MRYALIALLVLFNPFGASAQKHRLLIDAGLPAGFSMTYNYQLTKHLCTGVGVQGYSFAPTGTDKGFIPALYADFRVTAWAERKNQFFTFMDIGINIYKQDKTFYRDSTMISHFPHNNGFYAGLGLGYFRRMTKNGGGPYLSLKLISNWYTIRGYSIVSERQDIVLMNVDAYPVISIGFKF